jgi:hypothetical protein
MRLKLFDKISLFIIIVLFLVTIPGCSSPPIVTVYVPPQTTTTTSVVTVYASTTELPAMTTLLSTTSAIIPDPPSLRVGTTNFPFSDSIALIPSDHDGFYKATSSNPPNPYNGFGFYVSRAFYLKQYDIITVDIESEFPIKTSNATSGGILLAVSNIIGSGLMSYNAEVESFTTEQKSDGWHTKMDFDAREFPAWFCVEIRNDTGKQTWCSFNVIKESP